MSDNKSTPASKAPSGDANSFKTVTEASTTSPAARATATPAAATGTTTTPGAGLSPTSTSPSTGGGKSAGEMMDETKKAVADEASNIGAKAKAEASGLMDKAHDMADSKLDEIKSTATGRMDETAENIRNAGHEFGDDSYQAQAADYLATNLSRAADMVRNQSLGSLTQDVSAFARRNPAMFLGGAALLGFAAARLMKASERTGGYGDYRPTPSYRGDRFDAPPAGVAGTPYSRPVGTTTPPYTRPVGSTDTGGMR